MKKFKSKYLILISLLLFIVGLIIYYQINSKKNTENIQTSNTTENQEKTTSLAAQTPISDLEKPKETDLTVAQNDLQTKETDLTLTSPAEIKEQIWYSSDGKTINLIAEFNSSTGKLVKETCYQP